MRFTPLTYEASAANCPFCNVFAHFLWFSLDYHISGYVFSGFNGGKCYHCSGITIWKETKAIKSSFLVKDNLLIHPIKGNVPAPNDDLPGDILKDYTEASTIVELSPRGAAALLRLALQKLCKHLGEKGENINSDIKSLVQKGLSPTIQKALDSIRVTGNSAVHPGVLDISDDRETAYKMFGFLNIIAEVLISQPKKIDEYYEMSIPDGDKAAIEKRDKK